MKLRSARPSVCILYSTGRSRLTYIINEKSEMFNKCCDNTNFHHNRRDLQMIAFSGSNSFLNSLNILEPLYHVNQSIINRSVKENELYSQGSRRHQEPEEPLYCPVSIHRKITKNLIIQKRLSQYLEKLSLKKYLKVSRYFEQVRKELRGNSHERFFSGCTQSLYKLRNEMPIWT